LAIFEAIPVGTDTNEPPKTDSFALEALPIEALPVETSESAIPVEIDERNQLAIPFANTTEPSIFTLETDELAIPSANTTEPSVEDVYTFNTLISPPSPLCSIPAAGFGQFHTLQRTNGSITPTFTEFGRFQALQRTGVG
jgi:hypothetical protein